MLVRGNVKGDLIATLFVLPYATIPSEIAKGIPSGWEMACSENGWVTATTFTNILQMYLIYGLKRKIL